METLTVKKEGFDIDEMPHVFGKVRAFNRDEAEETRTIDFIISDETKDRHGTVIPVKNWKLNNFNNNGIVGYQHEVYGDGFFMPSDPDDVIGTGKAFVEDGKLIGRVTFEPEEINKKAEKIFQKVLHGTLKATSVGFIENTKGYWGENEEASDGANPTYYFGEVELLEFSIVNIPSNPLALRRKMSRMDSTFEKIMKDVEMLEKNETLEAENNRLKQENTELQNKVATLQATNRILKLKGLNRS
jgi:hypothetical protein